MKITFEEMERMLAEQEKKRHKDCYINGTEDDLYQKLREEYPGRIIRGLTFPKYVEKIKKEVEEEKLQQQSK